MIRDSFYFARATADELSSARRYKSDQSQRMQHRIHTINSLEVLDGDFGGFHCFSNSIWRPEQLIQWNIHSPRQNPPALQTVL